MKIETVLLVDDDPSIRMVAEMSLSRVGKWKVFLAESGRRALELAPQERPDVILLDVMMPEMDGPTTFLLLKRIVDVPIIFVTAKIQKHEVEGYHQLGAAGVISKPFDPLLLPAEIQKIVDNYVKAQASAVSVANLARHSQMEDFSPSRLGTARLR